MAKRRPTLVPAWRLGGGYKHIGDILGTYGTYYLDTALTVCEKWSCEKWSCDELWCDELWDEAARREREQERRDPSEKQEPHSDVGNKPNIQAFSRCSCVIKSSFLDQTQVRKLEPQIPKTKFLLRLQSTSVSFNLLLGRTQESDPLRQDTPAREKEETPKPRATNSHS